MLGLPSSAMLRLNSGKADCKAAALARVQKEFLVSLKPAAQVLIDFTLRIIERVNGAIAVAARAFHRRFPIIDVEEDVHHAFTARGQKR